jgi:hypothetical protein
MCIRSHWGQDRHDASFTIGPVHLWMLTRFDLIVITPFMNRLFVNFHEVPTPVRENLRQRTSEKKRLFLVIRHTV